MTASRKQALGKGLSALLGSSGLRVQTRPVAEAPPPAATEGVAEDQAKRVRFVALDQIRPNPRQPRSRFDQEKLKELSESIANHGVLQPVLVVEGREGGYVLLAGERRLRAAELAGLREIPVLLTEATDEEMLEIAIVENVQRDDLNPVEEAKAYKSLIDSFGWSHENIAHRVGKNRSTVANSLRLLKLNGDVLRDLEAGKLTAGHARALLSIGNEKTRELLHQEITTLGLSVREAERRAIKYQGILDDKAPPPPAREKKRMDEGLDTVALQQQVMEHLGCRVRIKSRDGQSGVLEIPFADPDELQRFLDAIKFSF